MSAAAEYYTDEFWSDACIVQCSVRLFVKDIELSEVVPEADPGGGVRGARPP